MAEVMKKRRLVGKCVTPVKLNEINFFTWSGYVKQYLNNLNKLHCLDKNCVTPDPSNVVEYKQWKYDDLNILCSLFNSMEDSVYQLFRFSKTVSDLWVGLMDHYADPKLLNFRKYQLRCEMVHHTKQEDNQPLPQYVRHCEAKWIDLESLYDQDVFYMECRSLGAMEQYKQEERLSIECLWGLNVEDDPLRIMILDMVPLPCLSKIDDLTRGYNCLQYMGIQSKSWPEVYQQQQVIRGHGQCGSGCTYCGHTNHEVSTCYKFREYLVRKSARLYD